jgi:hypothetical protein
MKLYNSAISGNSYKVRLLLNQLGIPCQIIEIDILEGEGSEGARGRARGPGEGSSLPLAQAANPLSLRPTNTRARLGRASPAYYCRIKYVTGSADPPEAISA